MLNKLSGAILTLTALVGLAPALSAEQLQQRSAPSHSTMEGLPPIEGMWLPDVYPFVEDALVGGQRPLPPELKPEAAERARAHRQALLSGGGVDRGYCEPARFGGRMPMNVGGVMEILLTPGRVTVATEAGLVRRIYLNPEAPAVLEESRGGTSTGRVEGSTLVIQTTGMSPSAWFLPGVELGRNASSTERFILDGLDRLRIETVLIAPDLASTPLTLTNTYRRAPDRIFTEFDTCPGRDRSFDGESGREQFDATPPEGLPPPPTE